MFENKRKSGGNFLPISITQLCIMVIFRDYLMSFWLSPKVSTRDPIISLRVLAQGLIILKG